MDINQDAISTVTDTEPGNNDTNNELDNPEKGSKQHEDTENVDISGRNMPSSPCADLEK